MEGMGREKMWTSHLVQQVGVLGAASTSKVLHLHHLWQDLLVELVLTWKEHDTQHETSEASVCNTYATMHAVNVLFGALLNDCCSAQISHSVSRWRPAAGESQRVKELNRGERSR